ncbi:hypothetical protein [Deinococcus knuensis]|uniref:ABC transporter permease n=1 Tax=Deinococcus knuensis TaxID=1837380 RepID=A0ABQ2SU78_9DEIO|nr:hypothetical protein [Deinococcus knuensis]GGS38166.1 hypothetical protein GCM10008961_32140 [Deinococcus knuensis]
MPRQSRDLREVFGRSATESLCRSRAVPVVLVLLALPGLLLEVLS